MRTQDPPTRPGPRRRGFTLVEVIVATMLLALAALAAFPTMVSCFGLSQAAREENLATHDLMAAVEDVMAAPFSVVTTTYPDGQPIPKFDALHLQNESITVSYVDPTADPLLITLVANWSDCKGRPRQEVFRCARTR